MCIGNKEENKNGNSQPRKENALKFFLHFSGERKNRITSFDVSRLNMYIANILNEPKLQSYILDCFIVNPIKIRNYFFQTKEEYKN